MTLLRQSIEAEDANRDRASAYLYTEDIKHRVVVGERTVESASQRYEVIFLAGQPYFRLVGRQGVPLDGDEEAAEIRRMETVAEERHAGQGSALSRAERPRISLVYGILPDSHEIHFLGEEQMDGRATWVVEATPKRRSGGGGLQEKETRVLRVKVWIDQETKLRVRQDGEATKRAGRLDKGAVLSYRFAPQADGVWLVRQILFRTRAGGKRGSERYRETEQSYSNYHKFRADSVVLSPK